MSTLFVVMVPEGSYQCEVEEEDIPKGYYEAVAFNEGQALSVRGKLINGKDWIKTYEI